jgi:thiol-disulfide isomerase/thioredoxin
MRQAASALIAAMTPGLAVLGGALVIAVIGGTVWRQANGKMRSPRARAGAGASVPLRAQVLEGAGIQGAGIQGAGIQADADGFSASGTLESTRHDGSVTGLDQGITLSGDQLGHALGEQATLVQFSSAFCAPCRATRRILAEVALMTDGVAHIEIDAESRLDLVRQLNVLRTPTVLVLAGDGRIVRRASGQPRKPDVIAAIGEATKP